MELQDIATVVTTIMVLASAITAATPTPKDDGIVKTLYKIIEAMALVVGKAKQK